MRLNLRRRFDLEHRAEHVVGPEGGNPLQACAPCCLVQALEFLERIVLGHIHGLADRGIHKRLNRFAHPHMVQRRHLQGRHKTRRQHGALHTGFILVDHTRVAVRGSVKRHNAHLVTDSHHRLVQPVGVILDLIRLRTFIRHALLAGVEPAKCRFDAV